MVLEAACERVIRATSEMKAARSHADESAAEAIEEIERRVAAALDREILMGLPDMGDRVYGVRVGADVSAFAKVPRGAPPCLAIDRHGMLVAVSITAGGTAFVQRAPRGMIKAGILEPYMSAMALAIDVHVRSAERRTEQFEIIRNIAERIRDVLNERDAR